MPVMVPSPLYPAKEVMDIGFLESELIIGIVTGEEYSETLLKLSKNLYSNR